MRLLLSAIFISTLAAGCVPSATPSSPSPVHTPGCDDPNVESLIRSVFVEDPDHAVHIAIRESHCRADAFNPSGASGVFQLMEPTHADLLYAVCLDGDAFLAQCNVDAAHLLWQSSGWRAWGG